MRKIPDKQSILRGFDMAPRQHSAPKEEVRMLSARTPPRAPPLAEAPSTPVAAADPFEDSCEPEVEPSPLEFDFDQRPRFAGADDDEGL